MIDYVWVCQCSDCRKKRGETPETSKRRYEMELINGMTTRPKKDYQADIRRRCDCGGHIKRCPKQVNPTEKLECFCTTCYRMHTFKSFPIFV